MSLPTVWCARSPDGRLLPSTIGRTRRDVFLKLYQRMNNRFQTDHWKKWEKTLRSYRKMGFTVEKCVLMTLTKYRKNVRL